MRIESLAKIIDGELLNFPSITYIDQLKTDAKQIKRADAYICKDGKDIQNAIQNGAYAIISDKKPDITDNEIAWIQVDTVEKAIIRYLRYKTIQLESKFFLCDDITFEILKSITSTKDILFLSDDTFDNFLQIVNADDNTVFISSDKKVLNNIYPAYLSIEETNINFVKVIKQMLFTMDFIYEDTYYKDVHLPSLFLNELNKSIKFLKKLSLSFSLAEIKLTKHFRPMFVDNALNIKDFGQTGKVFIEEVDDKHIKKEVRHLNAYAKYAKNILLVPCEYKEKYNNIEVKTYTDFYDIIQLSKENYNFFLILNKEKKDIFTFLNEMKEIKDERSLF